MKKLLTLSLSALILLSGCGTYTGQGAATGAQFGAILGSAIGGINGGPRGHDMGTLVGLAGGAVVGAAIGAAADKRVENEYQQHKAQLYGQDGQLRGSNQYYNAEGNNNGYYGGGNDIIVFEGEEVGEYPTDNNATAGTYDGSAATHGGASSINVDDIAVIEMVNPRFIDGDSNGILTAGEECKVVFEIMNRGRRPIFNITPTVVETTGNKRIHISQNILVESIMPGRGVRYTATVLAGTRLKDGEAIIRLGILHNGQVVESQQKEFKILTRRKLNQ